MIGFALAAPKMIAGRLASRGQINHAKSFFARGLGQTCIPRDNFQG